MTTGRREQLEAALARANRTLAELKKATAPTETLDDDTLALALTTVSNLTGETDVGALTKIIGAALGAPVDMHGAPGAAAMLAAALATPATPAVGLPDAEGWAAAKLEPLAKAAEYSASTGGVPRAHLAMARSDVEAITYAKGIKPTRIGPDATAREHADRRGDLTALRDRAKAQGNVEGAAMWQRELDVEEAKAATRVPTSSVAWGARAVPLA